MSRGLVLGLLLQLVVAAVGTDHVAAVWSEGASTYCARSAIDLGPFENHRDLSVHPPTLALGRVERRDLTIGRGRCLSRPAAPRAPWRTSLFALRRHVPRMPSSDPGG